MLNEVNSIIKLREKAQTLRHADQILSAYEVIVSEFREIETQESIKNLAGWTQLLNHQKEDCLVALTELIQMSIWAPLDLLTHLIDHKHTVLCNEAVVEKITSAALFAYKSNDDIKALTILSTLSSQRQYKASTPSVSNLLITLFQLIQLPDQEPKKVLCAISILANIAEYAPHLTAPIMSVSLIENLIKIVTNHSNLFQESDLSRAQAFRAVVNLSHDTDNVHLLHKTGALVQVFIPFLAPHIADQIKYDALKQVAAITHKSLISYENAKILIFNVVNLLSNECVIQKYAAEVLIHVASSLEKTGNQVLLLAALYELYERILLQKDKSEQLESLEKLLICVLSTEAWKMINQETLLEALTQVKQSLSKESEETSHHSHDSAISSRKDNQSIIVDQLAVIQGDHYSRSSQLKALRLLGQQELHVLVNTKELFPALERLVFKLVFEIQDSITQNHNIDMIERSLYLLSNLETPQNILIDQISVPRFFSTLTELVKNKTYSILSKIQALGILKERATRNEYRKIIAGENAIILTLFQLSEETNPLISVKALQVLFNLCSIETQMLLFGTPGLIHVFREHLKRTNYSLNMMNQVTSALERMGGCSAYIEANIKTNALVMDREPDLVPLLLDLTQKDSDISKQALDILGVFAEEIDLLTCTERLLPEMYRFAEHQDGIIRDKALHVLLRLTENNTDNTDFYDSMLPTLMKLAKDAIENLETERVNDAENVLGTLSAIIYYSITGNKNKILANEQLTQYIKKMDARNIELADLAVKELGISDSNAQQKLKRKRMDDNDVDEPNQQAARTIPFELGIFTKKLKQPEDKTRNGVDFTG